MIRKKQVYEPEKSLEFSEELLPRQFTPIETQLLELMRSPDVELEEFEEICQRKLDFFITGVQPKVVGAVKSVENRYDDVRKQLDEEQAQKHRLLSIIRICELYGDKGRSPLWYWGLYIVLILASMAIFATNFGLIIPDREWIGLLSSPIAAAFSYFMVCEFMRRPDKDHFLKHTHWMGILASIIMLIGFAVTRALAYILLSGSASSATYSPGSFLSNQSSSAMDTIQTVAAVVTFLAAMVTEIAFAGRLYISISEYYAAQHSRERIETGLEGIEEKIQTLQNELCQLGQQLAFLRGFDAIADAWKRAKLQELALRFKEIQSEVRNELQKQVAQLPISELRKLVGARGSIAA
jgi:hypothetical protein